MSRITTKKRKNGNSPKKSLLAPSNCKLNACVGVCRSSCMEVPSPINAAVRGRSCQTNNFQVSPIMALICLHFQLAYEKWKLFLIKNTEKHVFSPPAFKVKINLIVGNAIKKFMMILSKKVCII